MTPAEVAARRRASGGGPAAPSAVPAFFALTFAQLAQALEAVASEVIAVAEAKADLVSLQASITSATTAAEQFSLLRTRPAALAAVVQAEKALAAAQHELATARAAHAANVEAVR